MNRIIKLLGEDMELGNFLLGDDAPFAPNSADQAARALLREIDGHSPSNWRASSDFDAQDWGRKYLAENGACIYIDLSHLELALPELRSAFDATAAHHAMLRIARRALVAANARRTDGRRLQVLVNNSDRMDHSYGSHLSVLVTRDCWNNLFRRKPHQLAVLAAHQVSSIVFTGQGKVGSENDQPDVDYQITQRADFFEVLEGVQTTYSRPIVNSRDEALCGRDLCWDRARLHCIFYDNTLCHTATLLKAGVLQIVLAMLEANVAPLRLVLDDPVAAVVAWSHDPDLRTRCMLASGEAVTAVELQLRFLDEARRFAETGGLDTVPRADEILSLWEQVLRLLERRDFDALAGHLDWVLKRRALEHARAGRPDLDWSSPEIRYLDLLYSSLDSEEGLYWAYEQSGAVVRQVSEAEIQRFETSPPDDTRAWARAMLLRRLDPGAVDTIDWDRIAVRVPSPYGYTRIASVDLSDPLGSTRDELESFFRHAPSQEAIVLGLEARQALTVEDAAFEPAIVGVRHD